MCIAVTILRVPRAARVVVSSKVVPDLVTEAVVAQGAGLLGNGHHVTVPDAIK